MMTILARLAVIAAGALALAGCVSSEYDLSADLAPQFPLSATAYTGPDGQTQTFAIVGNGYVVRENDDAGNRVRFFKIPEYDGYVFQFELTNKDSKTGQITIHYGYYLADLTANGFVVRDWTEAAKQLPAHIGRLVTLDKDGNLAVKDARRDTLYVVREMARAKLPTKELVYTVAEAAKKP